ncbi:uncharacterized protein LOC106169782 [Lingula anatina]|uniref:Uncharacterized protein LOC106169782 n=1 Tax=Lingula anatina TaxID=7574 RepID=A0A1S3J4T2_LINAN|nr:uncharacterized protein LOC106169782 [Lingula anatina]|eukprot:XP_013404849.1 uncharacterized protein LOC106169782 [Lingula anatina]
MALFGDKAKKRWWLLMIVCLTSQHFYPVISHANQLERKTIEKKAVHSEDKREAEPADERLEKSDTAVVLRSDTKILHRQKRVLPVLVFILVNFWDDLVCLGLNLATMFNCGSLTPGTCQKIKDLDKKRDRIKRKVNQTLDEEAHWSVLNRTNDKAITSLYMIGKELELVASSNIRLMENLKALEVVQEQSEAYVPDDNNNLIEQQVRFRMNVTQYLNGMKGVLEGVRGQLDMMQKKDYMYFAMATAIPLLAMHTGLITTSARTALLTRSQNYQVVEFFGKKGSYQLATNPQGKMFIVQENPQKLGKLKVYAKLDSNGKVGKFWKFMMPSGQRAATNSFLNSIDFKQAQRVVKLQALDPDYLKTLKKTGYTSAFLRSTDGLDSAKFTEFVNNAKTKQPKALYGASAATDASLPKWMRQVVSPFDPSDVKAVSAYNKLKAANPALLADLEKTGKIGNFLDKSKGLPDADFDDYVKKVKSANTNVDGLKNFDFDAPAKKVKWGSWQKMKSGWRSFSNKNLFNFRGRKVCLQLGRMHGLMYFAFILLYDLFRLIYESTFFAHYTSYKLPV